MLTSPKPWSGGKECLPRSSRFGLAVVVLEIAACAAGVNSPAGTGLSTSIVLTQVPADARHASRNFADTEVVSTDWFEGSRVVKVSPDGEVSVLTKGFHSACDPAVSFDGRRILFAGKKDRKSHWSIWETGVEGENPRQITKEQCDCRHPIYLSSLFTLDSPEPWFTVLYARCNETFNEQGTAVSSSLYSVKLDGQEPRRVTLNPNGDTDPVLTMDGRVIYAGWRHLRALGAGRSRLSLFSINIDGTDQELYGAEQGKRLQRMPCATEGGTIVFVESDVALGDGAGQLGSVRESRPFHSYREVTDDTNFAYLYPSPLRGNTILVSRRSNAGQSDSGVFALDLDTGRAELVFDSPDFHDVQARILRPQPVPDGRSTVVNTDFNTGTLYALNLYEADELLLAGLAPGCIERVRVIEGVPGLTGAGAAPRGDAKGQTNSPRVSAFGRRILGEAPVEKDGSFHLLVPADIPIELQALDADGLALATCQWIWVKQRENRGCIGCHEDHELVPENIYAMAVQRPSSKLTPPPERRRSVAFREHILPILQAKCASADCHGGRQTPLRMVLQPGDSSEKNVRGIYEALLAGETTGETARNSGSSLCKYVEPGRARTSFLIWQLFGRDSSRPWDRLAGPLHTNRKIMKMPPPYTAPSLSDEEFRLFVEWIDLGAAWEAPPKPAAASVKQAPKTSLPAVERSGGM